MHATRLRQMMNTANQLSITGIADTRAHVRCNAIWRRGGTRYVRAGRP